MVRRQCAGVGGVPPPLPAALLEAAAKEASTMLVLRRWKSSAEARG